MTVKEYLALASRCIRRVNHGRDEGTALADIDAVLWSMGDPEALLSLLEDDQARCFVNASRKALHFISVHRMGLIANCGCFLLFGAHEVKS